MLIISYAIIAAYYAITLSLMIDADIITLPITIFDIPR